ncbi:MAG: hypothetical protein HC805_02960 [Alkalinema sp. RL_2_19]|nr:hypothetical protein [Alkalinema sp. RL_2_19]
MALAATEGQKFALLIGVDSYPQDPLKGCITDVELQKNLLVQRFGFSPDNIVQLTNQTATLDQIKQVFDRPLQLQSSDLLIVHFSGKGTIGTAQQPTLLLSGDELLLLSDLSKLLDRCGTQKIITVLDTSYQTDGSTMVGNLRVRSPLTPTSNTHINIANASLPGTVLSAAATDQLAVEVDYPDFSAGRFTYGLTQALWNTASKSSLEASTLGTVNSSKRDRKLLDQLLAGSVMAKSIGAFTHLDRTGTSGEIWLGGLPAPQLATINAQALLKADTDQTLQVVSRQGLTATVRVNATTPGANPLTTTTAIAEQLRTIPHALAVQIAIDHSLSRVERIDAVGAFSGLPNVTTKLVGEGAADYILARVPDDDPVNNLVAALPNVPIDNVLLPPRYALFTADKQRISTTSGTSGEAVKTMVKRFAPIVEALYADKILNLLENQVASNLAVSVEGDRLTPEPKLMFRQATTRAQVKTTDMRTLPRLAAGTQLCYRATNQSNTPLYWLLIGWNIRHDTYVVLPPVDKESSVLGINQTIELPFRDSGAEWLVRRPTGESMVYFVASDRPFVQTAEVLKVLNAGPPEAYLRPILLPLTAVQALLRDLSAPGFESTDTYGLDMNRYAVLPLQYRVV